MAVVSQLSVLLAALFVIMRVLCCVVSILNPTAAAVGAVAAVGVSTGAAARRAARAAARHDALAAAGASLEGLKQRVVTTLSRLLVYRWGQACWLVGWARRGGEYTCWCAFYRNKSGQCLPGASTPCVFKRGATSLQREILRHINALREVYVDGELRCVAAGLYCSVLCGPVGPSLSLVSAGC